VLEQPTTVQLEKGLCKWFTAIRWEGKHMTALMIAEKGSLHMIEQKYLK
jgi:hypothetical protein